jgi:hypothetical protein
MQRLLKEPLLHFLLIGAALFVIYGMVNETGGEKEDREIVVSTGHVEQLVTVFQKTWQRPPTQEELQGLINDFLLEEVYYRQAVAMGIDRDDTIIRRRLRQKLEFLSDDTASLVDASDEDLSAYLAANEDKFLESPAYTFRQAYFDPEKHGDDPEAYVKEQLRVLRAGTARAGDVSLLPESFDQASRREVDGTFGAAFSRKLDELAMGDWQGPVRSGLGLHAIRLEKRAPGRLPALADIRAIVEREWQNEKRVASRQMMNERLLEKYEVVIEWPDGMAPDSGEGGSS